MANLADISFSLKEVVLPYIRDNFPKESILLDQMKRNVDVEQINDEFVAPVYTSRHGGVTNMANDGNNVNAATGRVGSRGTVPVEIVSAAFNISKLAIDASASKNLAVESALTSQANSLAIDFGRHVNRQLYGDGVGVITKARATGGSAGAALAAVETVDASVDDGRVLDKYGTINSSGGVAEISPTKYVANGQILGVGTAAAAVGTVSSYDGTSITFTANTAIAANDAIYILDGSGGGAGTSEFLGVGAAVSSTTGTSTYAGLARSTQGWTPQFGSANEALTQKRMEDTYLAATEYASKTDKYIILVNKTLFGKYGQILTSMRRVVNESDLLGGWTGLEFAAGGSRVGVFLDYDVPDGEVIVLNLDTWTITQVSEVDWMEDPGGSLLRLENQIRYQAVMVWFANVLCLAPAANGKQTRKTA